MIPVVGVWIFSTVHLMSIGTPKYVPDSFFGSMEYENVIVYLFLFMLFGIFWVIAFIGAFQLFVIAATTCMWYFSGQGSDNADNQGSIGVLLSFKWGLWYHMGSLAWGAFLVAVVTMVRVIFEYFVKKMEAAGANNNPVAKALICVTRGCIWCLDCCIKFINKNAYIQVALHNTNFCAAAWTGFYLVVRHIGRFSASSLSTTIMSVLGKGVIIALSVWLTILSLNKWYPDVQSPVMPCVVVGCIAFVVSTMFLNVFSFSSLTILQCFLLDEDFGGSNRTPQSLQKFLDI